jgi:hypothetical protein
VSTALIPPQPKPETAVDRLRTKYEQIQKRDMLIVEAANRFADLPHEAEDPGDETLKALLASPDEVIRAQGWRSRRELRMAAYARMPKKMWPAAMQAAHERVVVRSRVFMKDGPKKAVFNLNMISIPAPKPQTAEDRVVVIEAKAEE